MPRRRHDEQRNRSLQVEVWNAVAAHPLLARMSGRLEWADLAHAIRVRVVDGERIQLNRNHRFSVPTWLWWIAHARLHLALGHPWDERRSWESPAAFATARCQVVNDLLFQLNIGQAPENDGRRLVREPLPEREPERLAAWLTEHGCLTNHELQDSRGFRCRQLNFAVGENGQIELSRAVDIRRYGRGDSLRRMS